MVGRKIKSWQFVVGIAVCASVLWTCDNDPTSPLPVDKGKDYAVFYWDGYDEDLHRYTIVSKQSDSVKPSFSIRDFAVSHDGQKLYFQGFDDELQGGPILDANTFAQIGDLPRWGMPVVSPNGRWLAILSDSLFVFHAKDFSPVVTVSGQFRFASFSPNGASLFAVRQGYSQGDTLYVVDMNNENECRRVWIGAGQVIQPPLVTPDERILYLYRKYSSCLTWIQVCDLESEAIISETYLSSGNGHIAMSPDGAQAYFTYATGPWTFCTPAAYSYGVYNRGTDSFQSLTALYGCEPVPLEVAHLVELALTPDGVHAVANTVAGYLGIRDLRRSTTFEFHCQGTRPSIVFIHIQGGK